MKTMKKALIFLAIIPLIIILSSCSKTAENEHLPEYCRSYSSFIEFASKDMYELVDGINRHDYLNAISKIELEFEMNDPSREIDLDGIQCFQNLTSLSLTGVSFKDISEISALKNIQEITLVETSVVSIDSFKNLSKVKSLTITNTKTLQTVKGVEEMTKLRNLELVGNGIVNIESLSKLTNLESLNLSNNEMVFFPSITGLESLTSLNLSNNKIEDLGDDLSGLAHLTILDLSHNRIDDLSNFDDLSDLIFLDLSNNNLGLGGDSPDFTSLSAATGLKEFYLNNNDISDISGLADVNIPNLEYLYLHENNISDISFISSYNNLIELTLYDNALTSIDNIAGMTRLTEIDLSDNNIISFGSLTNISGLEIIDLQNNDISVIPELRYDLPNLRYLDLSYNNLTDTSGIEGHTALEELYLDNNGLTTLSGLKDIPFLTTLSLFNDEVICEDEILEGELCENPKYPLNTNEISNFINSFVNLPSYLGLVGDFNEFNYDAFEFGENVTLVGSFVNIPFIDEIDFSDLDIESIDADSFSFPQLTNLFLEDNNFTDISFLLGNPSLTEVVLDGNSITNLEVINGTNTSDFDNLQAVYANSIITPNDLDGAFVDLPELSILELGNTNITRINNSLNDLPQLTELIINSSEVTEINNSFNSLFTLTGNAIGVENGIDFSDGFVSSINESFNDGIFEYIDISNQSPVALTTFITNSFNGISLTSSTLGLNLSSSDYQVITGSFNDLEAQYLSIANSNVNEITTSFDTVVLEDYMRLYLNNITTLPDLSTVSVQTLSLQSNQLTTVSFIHDIEGLETLNIDNQFDEFDVATLLTIDGINNQPLLTELTVAGLEITSIDGLKDIAITSFEYQADEHEDVQIATISATSFQNNVITQLNLGGHELDDVTFLDNFDILTELAITFTHTDISFFSGQDFEDSLVSLLIASNSVITDFAPLQGYDSVDTLVLITPFTNSYSNIDDMDALTNLNFYLPAVVGEFIGCFNTMPSWSISDDYLEETFDNLAAIRTSFNMITSSSFELSGGILVENSFDNVDGLTLTSTGEVISLIDGDSFDNLTDLTLDGTSYLSYASFADFENLDTVTFDNLGSDILDFTSTSVSAITVDTPDFAADVFNFDLPSVSTINIIFPSTDIGVGMTNDNITFSSSFDVAVSSTSNSLNIDGTMNNLLITSTDLTTVDFSGINVDNDIVMDTANVSTIGTTILQNNNASQLTVNSTVASLNYDATVLTMNINNDVATEIVASAITTVNVFSDETILDVELSAETINILNTDLIDLTGTFQGQDVTITSLVLNSLDIEDSPAVDYVVGSASPTFTLTGDGDGTLLFNNNNITSMLLSVPNLELTINTLVASGVTIDGNALELDFSGANATGFILQNSTMDIAGILGDNLLTVTLDTVDIPDVTVTGDSITSVSLEASTLGDTTIDGAVITNLNVDNSEIVLVTMENSPLLDNIIYVDSSVIDAVFDSDQVAINVSRTHPTINGLELQQNAITLSAINANNLTIDAENTDIDFTSNEASITASVVAAEFEIFNTSLTDITFDNASALTSFSVLDNDALHTVDFGTATVSQLDIDSGVTVMNISAVNSLSTTLSGDNFTTINADIGLNSFTLDSLQNTSMTLDIIANEFDLNADVVTINIEDTSNVTTLTSDSSNLTTVNAGLSTIGTLSILDSATILNVNGSNLTDIDISSNAFDTINAVVDTTADLAINSTSSNAAVEITTNTTDISVIMPNAGLTLYGANLDSATVDADDFIFAGTKLALTLDLNVTATTALFDTANIDGLTINDASNITTLTLDGTNMSSLVIGTATINTLDVTTDKTSFSFDGTIPNIALTAVNMSSISVLNNASAEIVVATDATTYDVNGEFGLLELDAANITSVDVSGAVLTDLDIISDSLAALNTFTSVSGTVTIESATNNFNLTTEADNVEVIGTVANNFILVSSKVGTINVSSNVQSMNITTPSSAIILDGANVNSLTGSVDEMTLNNNGLFTNLTVDMDAATFTYGASSVATGINFVGARTINDLVISGNALDISTSNIVDTSILLNGSGVNYDLDTLFDEVTLDNVGTANLDFNSNADVTVNGSSASANISGVTDLVTLNTTGEVNIDYGSNADVEITGSATSVSVTGITDLVTMSILGEVNLDYGTSADVEVSGSATTLNISGVTNIVTMSILGDVEIDYGSTASIALVGTAVDLTVIGTSINAIDTSLLTSLDTLVLDNTLVTTLDFIDNGLYTTLTEITMNTLDTTNVEDVITYLDGTGITLNSELVDQHVYDYFYDTEFAALVAQEGIDNVRYNAIRSTEVNEALAVFNLNTNLDFIEDADFLIDINAYIDSGTPYNLQAYMDAYAVEQGYTDEADMRTQLGDGAVDPIETSIQATLADIELDIQETALQAAVTTGIETDASNYATTESANKGWTIG